MSPNTSKAKAPTPSPDQNTTPQLRDHLRAFEYAKLERIVRANADTPAGAALRKKSSASAQAQAQADQASGRTPLLPKKAPWTSEERWEGPESKKEEIGEQRSVVAEEEEERAGHENSNVGAEEVGQRRGSLRNSIGRLVGLTATGYVAKKDEFGRYPI